MNVKLFEKILLEAVKEEIRVDLKIMRKYTSTWTNKPKWSIRSKRIAGTLQASMSTSDKPFVYVEKGTKVRYRKMSRGWRSKTKPGSLNSRSGSGRAAGFYAVPVKGIEARDSLGALARIRLPVFAAKTQQRLNASARLLFY